jgi:hypothetical protein
MELRAAIFVAIWTFLGLAFYVFFDLYKNTRLKRKVYPWFTWFSGTLFVSSRGG